MVVVVAGAELVGRAAVGHGVLDVGGDVGQVLDRVAVAVEVRRAPLGDVVGVGRRQRRAVVADRGREARRRVPAGDADRLGVVVAPVAADLERVIAADLAGQEVVHVRGQAVGRADVDALRARAAVDRAGHDQRRLDVGVGGIVEVEDEVAADVRVLDVEQGAIAQHPLVAELVGRVGPADPALGAEVAGDRALALGRLDRRGVAGVARVALLLVEQVVGAELVALEQLHLTLDVGGLEQRQVGVEAVVVLLDAVAGAAPP